MFGVDLDSLPPSFGQATAQGRVLILDGDGPAYVAAATVKRLDTAIRRFQQDVLKRMFMTGSASARVHLTARDSDKHGRFRVIAAKPYQGQRSSPKPTLLEPLREAMAMPENWLKEFEFVVLHRELEADDAMMQDAYELGEDGVTDSADKDLRMTPYPYWEEDRGVIMPSQPIGFVSPYHTPSGTFKCLGQGPMFFWAQMLMGDGADNIKGVLRLDGKLCGPAAAYGALMNVTDIHVAANLVVDAYRAIDQNVLAEAWLLWLTRREGDNVVKYFNEMNLTNTNRAFVQDCLNRNWVKPREEINADTYSDV